METRRRRRRGLIGPLLLVAIGVLLLLTNLGVFTWDAWYFALRFWPVLLIALGLELLIGRYSTLGSLIVVVAVLALIVAALTLAPAYRGTSSQLSSESISQPLQGAKQAAVDISYGAGTLHVGALSDSNMLIEGTAAGSGQVSQSFHVSGDTASYTLGVQHGNAGPFMPRIGDSGTWDLKLNEEVPMSLKINGGVGTAELDLSQLRVTSLNAELGVGRTSITMPSTGEVQATINGGVGETVVVIPSGMAARIQADSGLGGLNVPSAYQKEGNVYVSPDYGSSQNRVDLLVHGGIGRVAVQQ